MKKYLLLFVLLFSIQAIRSQSVRLTPGRQLLMDSALIKDNNLKRVYHHPVYYTLNPVLRAEKEWEFNAMGDPYAAPFSGGVWYDETDRKYKMWYSAGGKKELGLITCYAESMDGKRWDKPTLDVVPGTNIVDTLEHDCVSVLLDKFESDPSKRYKMFLVEFNSRYTVSMKLKYSADGIHWGKTVALSGEIYDRCAAYYDPFRHEYVLSLKTMTEKGRSRNFLAGKDPELLVSLAHRTYDRTSDKYIRYWFSADEDDPRNPDFPSIRPQIYNHEAMPYESLMLGYFTVWQGPENKDCDRLNIQKRNEVLLGWSKDGFHWNRENKQPFIPVDYDRNAWNAGNVQSTAGNPLIVGDSLYFYVSGRYNSKPVHDSNFATGLAMLRRDGFMSVQAGNREGYLTTIPFVAESGHLFINAAVHSGTLLVEVLDEQGKPIEGFTKKDALPIKHSDSTCQPVSWRNHPEMSLLKGRTISLRFYMTNGDLYSFWLSSSADGKSEGFTAGGGPGLDKSGIDRSH